MDARAAVSALSVHLSPPDLFSTRTQATRPRTPALTLLVALALSSFSGCGKSTPHDTDEDKPARSDGGDRDAESPDESTGTNAGDIDPEVLAAEREAFVPVALAEGLAPTPPMGWNSWNKFGCSITAQLIQAMADAMVSTGLKDAGYEYINIDDCWAEVERNADGSVQPTAAFPDGIKGVADYVHERGLKLGLYSDRGTATCAGRAGSGDHEATDTASYAAWGVDYLKYDNCNADEAIIEEQYRTMGEALQESGRDVVYSICAWKFYEWGVGMGHLWRTTTDIRDEWTSMISNFNANNTRGLAAYNGPNGWNDPDMLEVGNGGMTDAEYRTHFSLWAIASAPLIAGNNMRLMSEETKETLTNAEVIALNQDALGLQGVPVWEEGDLRVIAKPLNEYGARGVVLLNAGTSPSEISVRFADIGLRSRFATVRDLWQHEDLGEFEEEYRVEVPAHGQATLKISGAEPAPPEGTVALSDLPWIYAVNGLGPVELDSNVGATAAGDGDPISLRGEAYDKGLGVGAASLLLYRLSNRCDRFLATVGIEDATQGEGSVNFEVWGDNERLYRSDIVTGTSAAENVAVDVSGKSVLKLRVTNGLDGSSWDRAVWADARLECD